VYSPYFYVLPALPSNNNAREEDCSNYYHTILSQLQRKYESMGLQHVEIMYRQDLDMVNHLSPTCKGRVVFKLMFHTVQQLMEVRRDIQPLIEKNQSRAESSLRNFQPRTEDTNADVLSALIDIREYDVNYVNRVCIDLNIRAGTWYTITPTPDHSISLTDPNNTKRAEPTVLAFDIECTKAPLKFPDATVDEIFMISYMVNGQGFLIISRAVVSQDIDNFEYTPKRKFLLLFPLSSQYLPVLVFYHLSIIAFSFKNKKKQKTAQFPGPFTIFNERNEEALIRRFLAHYVDMKPHIVVSYNGDFFDWPFLEARAKQYNLELFREIGVSKEGEEYRGRTTVHLDAFKWVQRDSYLPQGSQGLKSVTKYKLGYDPVEVDPEDMVPYAKEKPVQMATYSVSDAVATYYLYETYVHMFIFSLCTIIPANPEDVLRKGSGTLCEALLMVEAYAKNIICPNKHVDPLVSFHKGHVLESETYIGGKVECLETGVYRSDIEYEFDMVPSAFDGLIANIDRDLTFAIEVENGKKIGDIINYDNVKKEIVDKLMELRDRPKRLQKPFVYHLDVGAMYPNIILTNRLQPNAIVDDETCAACDYNQAANKCKRVMKWVWRGECSPATKLEFDHTKDQLSREVVDGKLFHELSASEQAGLVLTRLKKYAKNAYKKTKVTEEEVRESTVCMRENDMYVSTVLRFRDRRYELKRLTKDAKSDIKSAKDAVQRKDAEDRALVYDSLQVGKERCWFISLHISFRAPKVIQFDLFFH
jgi:DNA polymerase epsilon subunit 1